jgi:hypothetical protein
MANSVQILDKLARNAEVMGLSVLTRGASSSVVLTPTAGPVIEVTYVAASHQSPMGGVDGSSTPFLGIGIAAPGHLLFKSDSAASGDMTDIFHESGVALKLLGLCMAFGNDVVVENDDASVALRMRPSADHIGLGM